MLQAHSSENGMTSLYCDNLPANLEVTISEVEATEPKRSRLYSCGIQPGHKIRLVRTGPFHGAIEFSVCNTHIALQRADAACIRVEA